MNEDLEDRTSNIPWIGLVVLDGAFSGCQY